MSSIIGEGMGGGEGASLGGGWCCKVEEIGDGSDDKIGLWGPTGMIEVWGEETSIEVGVI